MVKAVEAVGSAWKSAHEQHAANVADWRRRFDLTKQGIPAEGIFGHRATAFDRPEEDFLGRPSGYQLLLSKLEEEAAQAEGASPKVARERGVLRATEPRGGEVVVLFLANLLAPHVEAVEKIAKAAEAMTTGTWVLHVKESAKRRK